MLFHENEHRIYGDSPDRVADLLATVNSPALRAAYDAANYAFGDFDPVEGWEKTKEFTSHFHIKDWKQGGHAAGHEHGVIAGHRRRPDRAQHPRRGRDGVQGLRDDGTAPPRRRPDRRPHRAGPVPVRGRSLPCHPEGLCGERRRTRPVRGEKLFHRVAGTPGSPSNMLNVHLANQRRGDGTADPGAAPRFRGRRTSIPAARPSCASSRSAATKTSAGTSRSAASGGTYIDGACEMPLPAGVPLRVQAAKGPEYTPLDETVTLGAGQIALRFAIERMDRFASRRLGEHRYALPLPLAACRASRSGGGRPGCGEPSCLAVPDAGARRQRLHNGAESARVQRASARTGSATAARSS